MRLIGLLSLVVLSLAAHGAEVDQFTRRFEPLADMASQVNHRANAYLRVAVERTNAASRCDSSIKSEKKLYKEMTSFFANHLKGQLVKDLIYKDGIERHVTTLEDSIYNDWSLISGTLMSINSIANMLDVMSPELNIGGVRVGTDKFEHMFGQGLSYFKSHHIKGKSLRKTLKKGVFKEKMILGGLMVETGVFSYADFSANFNGMRFWNHVLQKRNDVLGEEHNIGPYVECVDQQWVVVESNPIDFRNYMDDSMDEAINCSKFATKKGAKQFRQSIARLSKSDKRYTDMCLGSNTTLEKVATKYNVSIVKEAKEDRDFLPHWIINKNGTGTVKYTGEFK
ncbi:MAG: hypothetical protein CME71_06195 [Halobacteriovorax sp.]|nr:hypothetical protein [Halobacteriovorax sp.]